MCSSDLADVDDAVGVHDIAMHAHRIIHVRDGKVEKDEVIQK